MDFTVKLNGNANKLRRVIANKLYAAWHDFDKYGTGMMFATRIGIADYMQCIRIWLMGIIAG
jgi:hypothetical protein